MADEPPGTPSPATESTDGRECGADGATGFKKPSTEDEEARQGKDEGHAEEDRRSEKRKKPRKRNPIEPKTQGKVEGERPSETNRTCGVKASPVILVQGSSKSSDLLSSGRKGLVLVGWRLGRGVGS